MANSQRNRDLLRDPIIFNVPDYHIALKDSLANLTELIGAVKGIVYPKMKWLTFFPILATKQFRFLLTSITFLSIKIRNQYCVAGCFSDPTVVSLKFNELDMSDSIWIKNPE